MDSASSPYPEGYYPALRAFVESKLLKNREVLRAVTDPNKGITTSKLSILRGLGFDSNYFTHLQVVKGEGTFLACFDYGYISQGMDKVRVMRLPLLLEVVAKL